MTPDEFVRRLRSRFGRLQWEDGLGGARRLKLNGRITVIGNFGSQDAMPLGLIRKALADLGLTYNDLED